ncbi:MAG: YybH family protein, partial [Blastocatellia bacterium]
RREGTNMKMRVCCSLVILTAGFFAVLSFTPASTRLPGASASLDSNLDRSAANDAEDIARVRAEWAKDLHLKLVDQLAVLYAPDAAFLQPTGERITGRSAIRELCKKTMDTFTSDITLHSILCEHSGDLAYDRGDYHETLLITADGTKTEAQGNYLMVYKRINGKWLIVEQVWPAVSSSPQTSQVGHN